MKTIATAALTSILIASSPTLTAAEDYSAENAKQEDASREKTDETKQAQAVAEGSGAQSGQRSDTAHAGPVLVLVPLVFASDSALADGCWARLYDSENFRGNMLTLTGPIDLTTARPTSVTGWELGPNYDSVAVGPKATLRVWDDENFRDETATFNAGQKIADLDRNMDYFEEIKSLRLSCAK